MYQLFSTLTLLPFLINLASCLPTISITNITHTKRWEAGPMLDGMNFPGLKPLPSPSTPLRYSFATRTIGSKIHIQIAQSSDFRTWELVKNANGTQRDALPDLPPWVDAEAANTWAPDVQQLDDGSFVMYFSATSTQQPRKHCTGAATAANILGPYAPQATPLICPLAQGGAIDAAGYNDNGQRYIVYKVDGNSLGHGGACGNTVPSVVPTPLILQPVEPDGVTLHGTNTTLLNNDGISDMGVIEAPSLVQSGNDWVLFFSSGCFYTPGYTVNYATAPTVKGPYTRAKVPLFATADRVYGLNGPGGMSIYKDAEHLVFHARFEGGRALYAAVVTMLEG